MTIQTIPDFVGASGSVPIAAQPTSGAANLQARRIFLCAHGSSNARYGDKANVGAARGVELPADTVVTISVSGADITDRIDLTQQGLYIPTGTSVSVSYGI